MRQILVLTVFCGSVSFAAGVLAEPVVSAIKSVGKAASNAAETATSSAKAVGGHTASDAAMGGSRELSLPPKGLLDTPPSGYGAPSNDLPGVLPVNPAGNTLKEIDRCISGMLGKDPTLTPKSAATRCNAKLSECIDARRKTHSDPYESCKADLNSGLDPNDPASQRKRTSKN